MNGRLKRTTKPCAMILWLWVVGHATLTNASELSRLSPVPQQQRHIPLFGVTEMAFALRFTAEINRQLYHASRASPSSLASGGSLSTVEGETSTEQSEEAPASHSLLIRGGSNDQDNEQLVSALFQQGRDQEEPLSIFHASSLVNSQEAGAARWGPKMAPFLQRALQALIGISSQQLQQQQQQSIITATAQRDEERILLLALLYMDRASSVDTPRSQEQRCALPYCLPRTVHRLSLAAMILAASNLNILPVSAGCQRIAAAFGMDGQQVEAMVLEMKRALGDFGTMVTPSQYRQFQQTWKSSPVLQQLVENQPQTKEAAETPATIAVM